MWTLMYHAVMRTVMMNFLTSIENRGQQMALNRIAPPAIWKKKKKKLRSSESPKFIRPWYWFRNRYRLPPRNYSELQPQCDLQEAATCRKTYQKKRKKKRKRKLANQRSRRGEGRVTLRLPVKTATTQFGYY